MEKFKYVTGDEIRVGDKVEIKRFLRPPIKGEIFSVYDPEKPMTLKGSNEYSVTVKTTKGTWILIMTVTKQLRLIKSYEINKAEV